jgi:nucleotide-binding universal stress UspA family protein
MINNVLIAVEDNKERMRPVIEHASEIADALSATVTLFHVYESGEFKNKLDARSLESADPCDIALDDPIIEMASEMLRDAGLEFTVVAATGEAGEEVGDYIDNHEIGHVFLGGRGLSPAGKALLGSVSQSVILNTDVPCTVVN